MNGSLKVQGSSWIQISFREFFFKLDKILEELSKVFEILDVPSIKDLFI